MHIYMYMYVNELKLFDGTKTVWMSWNNLNELKLFERAVDICTSLDIWTNYIYFAELEAFSLKAFGQARTEVVWICIL